MATTAGSFVTRNSNDITLVLRTGGDYGGLKTMVAADEPVRAGLDASLTSSSHSVLTMTIPEKTGLPALCQILPPWALTMDCVIAKPSSTARAAFGSGRISLIKSIE
jgi:hypothetical protein